jgi:hypothetical protein
MFRDWEGHVENQGTAIKGKLTTSDDSEKITTQNR